MSKFLLQMAGTPGGGKSQLALEVGRRTGAVVLDHDIVKSALLDTGIAWAAAGPAAYESGFAQARHLLRQGHSVVLDSACHYPEIPVQGADLAAAERAHYLFIECVCPDDEELERRRTARPRRRSQLSGPVSLSDDADSAPSSAERIDRLRWQTHRPTKPMIEIDTTADPAECASLVLDYIAREMSQDAVLNPIRLGPLQASPMPEAVDRGAL